jgi:ribosomal protein L23
MNNKILFKVEDMFHTSPQLLRDPIKLKQAIRGIFNVDVEDISFTRVADLVERIDRKVLEKYFGEIWQPKTKSFKYSGLAIIDEINSLNPKNVLDIGCGYNEFKNKINNLIGIDPYNDNADIKVSILDYVTDSKYDAIIAFGSINFGSTDKVFSELEKAVSLTAKNGKMFFRVNPGLPHEPPESNWISFYPWSTNFIVNCADYFGLDILDIKSDNNGRLYFVWSKPHS